MNDVEFIEWCKGALNHKKYIEFPDDIFSSITPEQALMISVEMGNRALIKLPRYEIDFFEWLKVADTAVWNDLWSNCEEEPYIVGASFLPMLIRKDGRGFPICDLLHSPNYYFSATQMVDEESNLFLDAAKERFLEKSSVSIAQLLVLEIASDPIDIWHFAYKHKLSLTAAKYSVEQLVEDRVLVHLKEAEHIAHFIDF